MKTTLLAVLFLTVAALLAACTPARSPSQSSGRYSLDYSTPASPVLVQASSVSVLRARAFAKGDDLVVAGTVKRPHELQMPGHLDLMVCTADGGLVGHETTRVVGLSSNRKGMLELPFHFSVDGLPPEGSYLRLRYHPSAAGAVGIHRCA
ncbi:MAG: hypothetical protein AB7D06_16210 [Pedobacter sp.]